VLREAALQEHGHRDLAGWPKGGSVHDALKATGEKPKTESQYMG
jgi:hypothetical protein